MSFSFDNSIELKLVSATFPFIGVPVRDISKKNAEMLNALQLPKNPKIRHGFFSKSSCGCRCEYKTYGNVKRLALPFFLFPTVSKPLKNSVIISLVSDDFMYGVNKYLWEDTIYVGLVSEYISNYRADKT